MAALLEETAESEAPGPTSSGLTDTFIIISKFAHTLFGLLANLGATRPCSSRVKIAGNLIHPELLFTLLLSIGR